VGQLGLLSQTYTSYKVKPAGALPDDSTDTGLQLQCIPVRNEKNRESLLIRNQCSRNRAQD